MASMKPVSGDFLALVGELNYRRISMVCGKMAQRRGGVLNLRPSEIETLKNARRLHARFRNGDYRATRREVQIVRALGEWLAEKHAENHNQDPKAEPFQWAEDAMFAADVMPRGTYFGLIQAIAEGQLDGAG